MRSEACSRRPTQTRVRLWLLSCLALALPATVPHAQAATVKAARSFTAELRYPGGSELIAWQAPEDFAVRPLAGRPMLGGTFARDGHVVYQYSPRSPMSILSRTFAARPDAPPLLDALRGPTDFVLARVRSGALRLRAAGAGAWRVTLHAPANKCAGFGSGTIELRLRRSDGLPLRLFERHGTVVARDISLTYRTVDRRLAPATFAAPKPTVAAYRDDKGFERVSPTAAAAHLSYTPSLPRWLPAGFTLAVSGWAPRSGTTGAEGSIPPSPDLFAAVYRRGGEEIDVTERLARAGDWSADPFGAECVRQLTETALIGGSRAVYGASEYSTPHLYWRAGRVLYTVSGPFPKSQLAAIARSLAPVR